MTAATAPVFESIAAAAARESPLWHASLREAADREHALVFSPLASERYALAVETIYEGYLLHYGSPRLFSPVDADVALLLGDYLYAHGLVHVAATGCVAAVRDLAELISLCAQARADRGPGEGAAWAATAALLGCGALETARAALREDRDAEALDLAAREEAGDEAVDRALAAHAARVR